MTAPTVHAPWILDRLHQNQTWQDNDGRIIPLADLSPERRHGALRWLRANAAYLWECQRIELALDRDRDGVACEGHYGHPRDGDDGQDGHDGRDGRDGIDRIVYVDRYVSDYLDRGGDRTRITDGGQVAIYPVGGVATGSI